MTLIESIIIAKLRHYETVAQGVELTVYGLESATGIPLPRCRHRTDGGCTERSVHGTSSSREPTMANKVYIVTANSGRTVRHFSTKQSALTWAKRYGYDAVVDLWHVGYPRIRIWPVTTD
jgi:hypothetical protein